MRRYGEGKQTTFSFWPCIIILALAHCHMKMILSKLDGHFILGA